MSRPKWFIDVLKSAFPNRFAAARLTRIPILDRLVETMLFEDDQLIYLPPDATIENSTSHKRTIPVGESITQPVSIMLPSQVINHFIEIASYHWIMDFCICRESSNCQDFPQNFGCLFLGEAVQKINPQFGRMVSKDEANAYAQRCRDAGLVHLVGRNKLDTFWLGVGPGENLLTICNCCPCCCLWKILPEITPQIGSKVQKMPGLHFSVNEFCVGCGTCTENICFVNAISLKKDHAVISETCRGCGRCIDVCRNAAIELLIEDTHFIDKTITTISSKVDLG